MTRWFGAVIVALTLMSGGPATIDSAGAATSQAAAQKPQSSGAIDLSARRRIRHPLRYAADRPYVQPHYYDRPDYYRPYPYALPVPFFLGFAFSPSW